MIQNAPADPEALAELIEIWKRKMYSNVK
jgi:hypothetical protein